ncbi:hypothetical protein AK812_SmicGene19021 [Symbiodinium microadriaticum]|uniref:C3H1-type domain-containing protein n=1 Tax=Symbiodinium microadriaticum TaxID=2951 RepID=A0A1Q9DTL6_SYMMI|nr:hypothetical protein AK812_SmicGene19021 [Symbiodinium microadriaticum]
MTTVCRVALLLALGVARGYKILLFWSVDSDSRTIELVKRNVAHARQQGGRGCCDVMLAHYSGSPRDWGGEWYANQVKFTLVSPGYKYNLLKKAYRQALSRWEDEYECGQATGKFQGTAAGMWMTKQGAAAATVYWDQNPGQLDRSYFAPPPVPPGWMEDRARAQKKKKASAVVRSIPEKMQMHLMGTCHPCVAFALRQGGCFKGDACSHCHFCSAEQATRRREELQVEARARRKKTQLTSETASQGATSFWL